MINRIKELFPQEEYKDPIKEDLPNDSNYYQFSLMASSMLRRVTQTELERIKDNYKK
jgi:hypothetical protein